MSNDYFITYEQLRFKASYSYQDGDSERLCFTIHPFEMLDELIHEDDYKNYMIHGFMDVTLQLHIGFKGFVFTMTKDFHDRLGKLYEEITQEFMNNFKTVKSRTP